MRRERERMPASGAGLMRYFEEEGSGRKVSPKLMLYFIIGVIIFEILLRFIGPTVLGF
ncbi:MAG: preprotein translocase subunit Sec61beta [Candidatus Hadarchaeales archaeon]